MAGLSISTGAVKHGGCNIPIRRRFCSAGLLVAALANISGLENIFDRADFEPALAGRRSFALGGCGGIGMHDARWMVLDGGVGMRCLKLPGDDAACGFWHILLRDEVYSCMIGMLISEPRMEDF